MFQKNFFIPNKDYLLSCFSILFDLIEIYGNDALKLLEDNTMRRINFLSEESEDKEIINLNDALQNFEKDDSSPHYKYLNETLQKVKDQINAYENEANNNISDVNNVNNISQINTTTECNINTNNDNGSPFNMNQLNKIKINQVSNNQNNHVIQINNVENKEQQVQKNVVNTDEKRKNTESSN